MAKDDEDVGLIERGKRYLKKKAAERGKELREKAEKSAKAEPDEAPAPVQRGPVMGPGGYGGRGGAEAQKRQIEQEERGEDPTTTGVSFKSSNQGQTGRQTATERRKRDNRLKSTMI